MAEISFDDLIPTPSGGGMSFDDLIPAGPLKMEDIPNLTPEQAGSAVRGAWNDLGRSVARGVPFMDRIAAGMGALTGIGGQQGEYSKNLEAQRAEDARIMRDSPEVAIGGQLVGSAALPLGALGAANKATTLAGKMLAGGAAGAGIGGVYGLSDAPDLTNISDAAGKTAIGAGLGGLIGGAVPAVAHGAGHIIGAIKDRGSVNQQLNSAGLSRPAGDVLMRTLEADKNVAGANLRAAGTEAMLADAGPSSRAVLDTAIQRSGPATSSARSAIDQRVAVAGAKLNEALDRTLGKPEGLTASTTAIREGTKSARSSAYEAAYDSAIDYSAPKARHLELMLKRVPSKAIDKANELMQVRGEASKQILADIAEDGTVTFKSLPDVRQWDYIVRGLKQVAKSGEGQGALGAQTPIGAAYEGLATNIRKNLRDLVPAYGKALDTAADPISRIEATKLGYEMLSPRTTRDELAATLQGMGRGEREAVKQGLRSHIDDTLANVKAIASDPNMDAREAQQAIKALSGKAVYEKFQLLLGDRDARELFKEVRQAGKATELYAGVSRNSATFGRTVVNDIVKQQGEPGIVGSLLEGRPVNAGQRIMQAMSGRTPQDKLAREDETYRQLAEFLTGKRGQDAVDALKVLTDARQAALLNATDSKDIGRRLGVGSGLLGYQLGRQLTEDKRRQ